MTDARRRLNDLVHRAEAGEEIVIMRRGRAVVRFEAVPPSLDVKSRKALIDAVRTSGAKQIKAGKNAAENQDILYGEDGMPE